MTGDWDSHLLAPSLSLFDGPLLLFLTTWLLFHADMEGSCDFTEGPKAGPAYSGDYSTEFIITV